MNKIELVIIIALAVLFFGVSEFDFRDTRTDAAIAMEYGNE